MYAIKLKKEEKQSLSGDLLENWIPYGTELHIALQKGSSLDTIRNILKCSVNINSVDQNGNTAIFVALYSHFNYGDVIKELLSHGASVNVINKLGTTPLHVALVNQKKLEIIQDILNYGADVNAEDLNGDTPIFKAFYNLEVVKLLLRYGACTKKTNKLGRTPLHNALYQRCDLEIIQQLLEYGSDVNARIKDDHTPVFESQYSSKIFKELVRQGASLLEKSEFGVTLQHLAVVKTNIVKEILKNGADANAKSNGGITPLYIALLDFPSDFQIVMELLKYGASIHECFESNYLDIVHRGTEIPLEVLAYSILEHPNDITCDMCLEWSKSSQTSIFRCRNELEKMKNEIISNKLTLLNFVTQDYDYGKLFTTSNDVLLEGSIFLQQLFSKYPIYHKIILNRLETRTYLLRKLCDTLCVIELNDKVIYLNSWCVRAIGTFLTNEGIKKFIKACS